MAKYRIAITNIEYGCIDVEADSLDQAMDKADTLVGDYVVHQNAITNTDLIGVLDKYYKGKHMRKFRGTKIVIIIVIIKVCLQEKNLLESV